MKIADIAGINDYGLPIYPYTILIIIQFMVEYLHVQTLQKVVKIKSLKESMKYI